MTDKNRRLMKINRIISNKKNVALIVIAIDVLSFLLINFIINSFAGITSSVGGKGSLEDIFTWGLQLSESGNPDKQHT